MPNNAFVPKHLNVVVADTSWLVRDGLARLLLQIEAACIIHTAQDGMALHDVLRTHPNLGLVLVGRTLVDDEEEPLFKHIHKLAPSAVIAIVGEAFEHERVRKAVYYGALGVVATGDTRDNVVAALRTLLAGNVALPSPSPAATRSAAPAQPNCDVSILTPREREVFAHLGEGLSVLLVAERLQLSPHTVRVHIARIMKKLDLRDRSALMHRAVSSVTPQALDRRSGTSLRC